MCSPSNGFAVICKDATGRNQIAVAPGANMLARAAQLDDSLLGPGTILLIQMEVDPCEIAQLILRARSRGAFTILNLAPAIELDEQVLRAVDLLGVNEDEATWLARHLGCKDDTAEALQRRLSITVIRTLGAQGAEAADATGLVRVPAARVEAVDTTAAGDCFVGVLAVALERGSRLKDAMTRAGVAAAIACSRHGSQASLPTKRETDLAFSQLPPRS